MIVCGGDEGTVTDNTITSVGTDMTASIEDTTTLDCIYLVVDIDGEHIQSLQTADGTMHRLFYLISCRITQPRKQISFLRSFQSKLDLNLLWKIFMRR